MLKINDTDRVILLTEHNTPTNDEGEKGEVRNDENFLYLCVNNKEWKKIYLMNLDSTNLVFSGIEADTIKANVNYQSSDGSNGATGSFTLAPTIPALRITVKNGLITGWA